MPELPGVNHLAGREPFPSVCVCVCHFTANWGAKMKAYNDWLYHPNVHGRLRGEGREWEKKKSRWEHHTVVR